MPSRTVDSSWSTAPDRKPVRCWVRPPPYAAASIVFRIWSLLREYRRRGILQANAGREPRLGGSPWCRLRWLMTGSSSTSRFYAKYEQSEGASHHLSIGRFTQLLRYRAQPGEGYHLRVMPSMDWMRTT